MKIFAGLSRTDYEDVFRAVGALIDERGWSNVSLMEVDEGLIVQVMIKADQRETKPRLETYLLTDSDLERVLRDAVLRRTKRDQVRQAEFAPAPPAQTPLKPPPPPSKLVEGLLAAKNATESRSPAWPSPTAASLRPSSNTNARSTAEFSEVSSQLTQITQAPPEPAPHLTVLPTQQGGIPLSAASAAEEVPLFAPEPMRLSPQPPEQTLDAGAARAAVVMAHIVAARIRSGVPITSDDPDLASLLEQVRALDATNIGDKP